LKKYPQVQDIFYYLSRLDYADKPDYQYIRQRVRDIGDIAKMNQELAQTFQRDLIMQQSFQYIQQQQAQEQH
jgi:hypothetical protein